MIEGGNSVTSGAAASTKHFDGLLACCESREKDVRGGGLNASLCDWLCRSHVSLAQWTKQKKRGFINPVHNALLG
jgi:hypothetical protein